MDALPLDFYDEVIHRLSKYDIEPLMLCSSGYWSSTAETHYKRRRELMAGVSLSSNSEGPTIGVKLCHLITKVPFDTDFKYDRIKSIAFIHQWSNETEEATLEQFQKKALPIIRSIASDCTLRITFGNTLHSHNLCDIIFDGLKDCSGLSDIKVGNYGGKCHQFIRRQIEFGNLRKLDLAQNTAWPADFQDLMKVFVKSSKFESLSITNSNLELDFDMVTCVFDRFFSGDLTGFYLDGSPSFPLDNLRTLYPQFAMIPVSWPSQWSTALWNIPLKYRSLEVTICGNAEITVRRC